MCNPTPAAMSSPQECGEQASMQSRPQSPRSRIKSAHTGIKKRVHVFALLPQPFTDMATATIPVAPLRTFSEPPTVARKPVSRKPVLNRAEMDNPNNVLKGSSSKLLVDRNKAIKSLGTPQKATGENMRAEAKKTSMEAFLMLFAMGAFSAWTVCLFATAVVNRK